MSSKEMFFIAVFALSVSCCLIATGAFVLLTTATASPQSTPIDSEISQEIKHQEDISKILNDKITQINERISRLQKSKPDDERIEVARKVKETIDYLKSVTSNLREGMPILRQKLADIQTSVQSLDILDAEYREVVPSKNEATNNSGSSQKRHVQLNSGNTNGSLL